MCLLQVQQVALDIKQVTVICKEHNSEGKECKIPSVTLSFIWYRVKPLEMSYSRSLSSSGLVPVVLTDETGEEEQSDEEPGDGEGEWVDGNWGNKMV